MSERPEGPAQDQYIQISANIFQCLSQVRPPIDYHFFDEKIRAVKRLHPAGQRVPKELAARMAELCAQGNLFLNKTEYRAFAEGLSKSLGALATEEVLNPLEVAGIFYHALALNLGEFILQPLGQPYAQLVKDTAILCEYVWGAPKRALAFPRVMSSEHKLTLQSAGTCLTGLAILAVREQGKMQPVPMARMALGLLLHDIGMENVIVTKLGKEGPLLNAEKASIKNHTVIGVKILDRLRQQKAVIPAEAEQCVKEHHERFNGKGYPLALRGENISLSGRLCAVADSFCAMVTKRPHAKALSPQKAAEILAGDEGYDPALTRILVKLVA